MSSEVRFVVLLERGYAEEELIAAGSLEQLYEKLGDKVGEREAAEASSRRSY